MSEENEEVKNQDPELSAWRSEWQGLGGREDFAAAVVARAAKDGRRARRVVVREVLAALLLLVWSCWMVARSRGAPEVLAMVGFILVFTASWLTYLLALRVDFFEGSGEGVEAFVALTRRRLAIEGRWLRFVERWTLVLGVAIVPWSVWWFAVHRERYLAEPWRAVVGFGGVAAILAGVVFWMRRKQQKLRVEERAFERCVNEAQLP
jgi:hypothetical protein